MKATIYEAAGGLEALPRLAAQWAEALGGPPSYTSALGDASSV